MKHFTLLLLALTSPLAQAHVPFNNFSLSGALGGTLLDADVTRDLTGISPGALTLSYPSHIHLEDGSFAGWLGLAYSHHYSNHLVLAAEATAGFANPEISHDNEVIIDGNRISTIIKTQLKNDFSLVFKPGYVFMGNTQIYALLGARWGNFESKLTTFTLTTSVSDTESAYQLGFTAGLGLEHLITDRLSLGLEYAYTTYGNIANPQTTSQVFSGFTIDLADEGKVDVRTNTLGARLSYHF